jgi:Sulfotransferase domain
VARPTFLIIGAMKSGTTSLHHYLGLHPEIQIPPMKELNFFSGPPGAYPYPAGSRRIEHLDDYENLFDLRFSARGEASPNYAVYPRRAKVPERIREVVPDVKLIYTVRDPIARAISQYQHHVASVNERRSLRDAILEDLEDPDSLYICPGLYAQQLEQYLRHFNHDNIIVIDQADLLNDRQSTLREIFGFLSVDVSFSSTGFSEELLTAGDHRSYSNLVAALAWARTTRLLRLPRRLRVFMRRSAERVVSRPLEAPILDADVRASLETLYAADVKRLRELTGKTFSTWSI